MARWPGLAVLGAGVVLLANPCASADPPGPGCEPPRICIRVPDVKKVREPSYSCKIEEGCTPTVCSAFRRALESCGLAGCGCADGTPCGRLRRTHVLLKRFVEVERPITKCVPRPVPNCPAVLSGGPYVTDTRLEGQEIGLTPAAPEPKQQIPPLLPVPKP